MEREPTGLLQGVTRSWGWARVQKLSLFASCNLLMFDDTNITPHLPTRPTDVIDSDNTGAEWQTLSQRISGIAHNIQHPVGVEFNRFTDRIEQDCKQVD